MANADDILDCNHPAIVALLTSSNELSIQLKMSHAFAMLYTLPLAQQGSSREYECHIAALLLEDARKGMSLKLPLCMSAEYCCCH